MGYVHIDDVALCQILVYEEAGCHGRYLCSSVVMNEDELAALLANRYPTLSIPRFVNQIIYLYKVIIMFFILNYVYEVYFVFKLNYI